MAFPAVVGSVVETNAVAESTAHTISLPSLAAGNLAIVLINTGAPAATYSALAGWTELLDENVANGLHVLYRLCDGTEGATIALTASVATRMAALAYEISGAISPATQAPQLSTVATGTSTAPNASTCTPTGGAKDYLWISFFGMAGEEADDDTWVNTAPSTPSAFGGLVQKSCGTTGVSLGGLIGAAHLASNAASLDAGAFAVDVSAAWRAYTLAIHPVVPVTITDVESDEIVEDRDTAITITGTNFKASQGDGNVELANNATYASATEICGQHIISWSDTAIDIKVNLKGGSGNELTPGTVYVFVKNSDELRNATGFAITVDAASTIKFIDVGTSASGTSTQPFGQFPQSARTGDLAICVMTTTATPGEISANPTADGWFRIAGSPFVQDEGGHRFLTDIVWTETAGDGGAGSLDPNWTLSASRIWAAQVLVYGGVYMTDPIATELANIETVQNDQPVHPGIDIERSGSALVHVMGNLNSTTQTAPTNFTERVDNTRVFANDDLTTSPGASGTVTGNLADPEFPLSVLIEIARIAASAVAAPPKPTNISQAVNRAAVW